jgi:hypothetical protein
VPGRDEPCRTFAKRHCRLPQVCDSNAHFGMSSLSSWSCRAPRIPLRAVACKLLSRYRYTLGSGDRPGSLLREAPYCKSCASSEGRVRKERGSCWESARRICKGRTLGPAVCVQSRYRRRRQKADKLLDQVAAVERLRTPKHSSQLRLRVRFPSRAHWLKLNIVSVRQRGPPAIVDWTRQPRPLLDRSRASPQQRPPFSSSPLLQTFCVTSTHPTPDLPPAVYLYLPSDSGLRRRSLAHLFSVRRQDMRA